MTSGRICNGPYLLAPGTRQMTVAWETEDPASFYVTCRASEGKELRR